MPATSESIGLFLRSSGADRAAKAAFDQLLHGRNPTANQIEFLNMVIHHIPDRGFFEPDVLYESPFVELSAKGVDGIFPPDQVAALFSALRTVRTTAM
jgi:type I restriction enzyme, R subunit